MSQDMAVIKTKNDNIKKERQLRWEQAKIEKNGRMLTVAYPTRGDT